MRKKKDQNTSEMGKENCLGSSTLFELSNENPPTTGITSQNPSSENNSFILVYVEEDDSFFNLDIDEITESTASRSLKILAAIFYIQI